MERIIKVVKIKSKKLGPTASYIPLDASTSLGAAGLIAGIVPLVADKKSFVHRYKGR